MRSNRTLAIALCLTGSMAAWGQSSQDQQNQPRHSLQAAQDPGEAAVLATCKTPPPARRGGGPPPQQPQGPRDYTVSGIPGVVAAGAKWTMVWKTPGNNADGIIASPDGGLLIAQNDNSQVVKLNKDGQISVEYKDTHTGGALSRNAKGVLFIDERGLKAQVVELAPNHKVVASTYNGDSLDCIGGVLNDLAADSRGGVYFTMGGLYYISPDGKVTQYGMNLRTNGIILSPNGKTLYVTNGPTLAAFDVQPDGSLTNQREFAKLEGGGNGDGSTIDSEGRIYVSTPPGVQVISPEGKYLGLIPTPRGIISLAFSGPGKKTLYAVSYFPVEGGTRGDEIYSIPMIASGFKGRAK